MLLCEVVPNRSSKAEVQRAFTFVLPPSSKRVYQLNHAFWNWLSFPYIRVCTPRTVGLSQELVSAI